MARARFMGFRWICLVVGAACLLLFAVSLYLRLHADFPNGYVVDVAHGRLTIGAFVSPSLKSFWKPGQYVQRHSYSVIWGPGMERDGTGWSVSIPLWWGSLCCGLAMVALRPRAMSRTSCKSCKYDLRGLDDIKRCPECGRETR